MRNTDLSNHSEVAMLCPFCPTINDIGKTNPTLNKPWLTTLLLFFLLNCFLGYMDIPRDLNPPILFIIGKNRFFFNWNTMF
ncbi:hypothetical protein DM01DRAFT_1008764 [Hesseltinella vesiculosa]|uniref:Uncharacterized protein n=1 Tax=Hesseltinella vesiculosa TaxID=101127 RepID=A0A1X2GXX8_9FUNG|nr:hypothetical protein DM01DRAFT_1008764 [Hesseltinella vesiculosa]